MLEKILAFVTVVDKNSFTLAKEELGISLSQISRNIQALEDYLGAKLINRNAKKITLTAFGQSYYKEALILISHYNQLEILCSTYKRELSGEIKILAAGYVVNTFILRYIDEFSKKYEKVKIHLEVAEKVINFKATDVDISFSPSVNIDSVIDNSSLEINAQFMFNSRFGFYASNDYLTKYGLPTTIDELVQRSIITHAGRVNPDILVLSNNKIKIKPIIYTNNASVNAELAFNGLGIVQILDAYIPDRLKTQLIEVLPEYGYELATHMYYLKSRENEPIINAFIQFIESKLQLDNWSMPK